MNAIRLTTLIAFGVLSLAATGPSRADTAVASDRISIFEMPRNQANEVVGMLRPGEVVTIDRCTPSGRWCRVFSTEPTGWVPASYLIGAEAKLQATPQRSLTDSLFGPKPLTPAGGIR